MIRVMIVDDHEVVRQGFAMFLKGWDDLEMVGQAANGEEALALFKDLEPDVILMDMIMPKMGGIEAIRAIKDIDTSVKIIILTSFSNDVTQIRAALAAGANGFLYKDVSAEELAQAIQLAHKGSLVLTSDASEALIEPHTKPDYQLSDREIDVLKLLVKGMSNPQIATELVISQATAKFHVSNILSKMGAGSRTEAASIAQQHNLV